MIADSFRNAGILPTRDRAIGRTRQILGRTAATVDAFLVVSALFVAIHMRVALLGPFQHPWEWHEYLILVETTAATWLLVGSYAGLYNGKRRPFSKEAAAVTWVTIVSALLLGAIAYFCRVEYLSRPLALIFFATVYSETLAFRALTRLPRPGVSRSIRRVIVVGSGPQAEKICAALELGQSELVGVITEDSAAWVPYNRKRLGTIEEAETVFRREVVDEVIFAVPKTKLLEIESAFAAAEDFGLETKLSLDFLPHRFAKIDYEELGGAPVLSFVSAPAHPVQLAMKRAFDVVVSVIGLILCIPIFIVVAAVMKLTSPGPLFFGQRRTGLNGRDFTLWKFRSMVPDADKKLSELLDKNEMSGPSGAPGSVFKLSKDPRVTPIGNFLRKTSIDELPQFWNVLIGDMSIVGPRPLFDVKRYDQRWHCRRVSVKPGITCTWQISGRNEIDFTQWMQLDLDYIDQWSIWVDLKIFFKTIPAVLLGRGAR